MGDPAPDVTAAVLVGRDRECAAIDELLAAALGLAAAEGADRFLVAAGVLSLLSAAADRGPLLCVVDDAQWLDVPSADALVFTARRLAAEGIAILFAAREGELRRFDAPGLTELSLKGLGRDLAMTMLQHSAPDAPAHVRERLLAEAAGNPLALLELPAGLSPEQMSGGSPLPLALPLTARLHATPPSRSVCGRCPPRRRRRCLWRPPRTPGSCASSKKRPRPSSGSRSTPSIRPRR